MTPIRTAAGQQVLKDRSLPLTPRQRAALRLADGERSVSDVLHAAAAAGVTPEDIERLFELNLLFVPARAAALRPAADAAGTTPQQRYAMAHPIALQLAAGLGLRGLRLSLAVEAASCYEDLLGLSARLRQAVGPERFAPLQAVLGPH
jgi:hypothetical protein